MALSSLGTAGLTRGASEARARMLNIAMLIGGYGVGQGSIFLAQTWLVARGELELLALFGTHFAFAMFGIIAVEAGSLTILARHAASMEHGEESVPAMWRHFWEMSIVRGALAMAVIAAALGFALLLASSPFSRGYVLFALPAFLFWAVNAAGFLDGLRLSGISGISGSIAYATSAGALVYAQDLDPASAGEVLGAAFSAGYALTVIVQFAALRFAGWPLRFERPTRRGITRAGIDGMALLGSTLPGQVYFRAQLLMCSVWLGAAPTALFVYVKQIVNAASQLTGFIRRVEFPLLVRKLAADRSDIFGAIFKTQKMGTIASVIIAIGMIACGAAMAAYGDGHLRSLGVLLAVFSVFVATGSIILGLTQGLAALGHYQDLLVRTVLASALGIAVSLAFVRPLGIYAFALADAASTLLSLFVLTRFFRRRGLLG